jgi:P4 family phage/plasmid primase-like protien
VTSPEFNWEALHKALQFYEKERLRYFPLVWGEKKPPKGLKWEPLQNRPPTFRELTEWFQEGRPTNIAIICGGASNGLVAICFNAESGAIDFLGQELWDKLLASTFVVKTSRGVHVYLRSSTPIPSQIVTRGDNRSWLEIRADGNYVAAPPSLHPSGVLYEAIGVENIVKPKNLPDFIKQRLTALGLKAWLAQEPARDKPAPAEQYLGGKQSTRFNEMAVKKLLENCAFIQYCRDNAATLTEPYWWAMVHNLAVFGGEGEQTAHELSKPYPQYTEKETNQKIEEAHKQRRQGKSPHLCDSIGFVCPDDCLAKKFGLKSPAGLAFRLATQEEYGAYLYHDKQGWHLDIPKLVDDLLTEYTFKTMTDNEECFVYKDGIYVPSGEVTIKEECEKRVPKEFMTLHNVNEVIGHIKRSTYADRKKFNQEKWILNLQNGLYNIQTEELTPHTPELLSTIRIPVIYDSGAGCLRIRQFFTEVLREEDIPVIEELFGYCLVPDYKIQRAFLFTGDGANGKSTLLELLKHFVGKDNCTNLSLQALVSHRFAVASLFGKLVNIYADIPSTRMESVGLFKMLTGGDTVRAEKKFKDDFFFTNYARLIFSTNKPPWVDEDTLAFWRRWVMINFPNKFEGDQADIAILDRLTSESETSGLLNIALKGLKRLLSRHRYSYQPSPDEVAEKYRKSANVTFAFVEDMCEPDPNTWISKDNLYDAFANYCKKQNFSPLGKESFGRSLKNVNNAHVKSRQRRVDGVTTWGWEGIRLIQATEEDIDMEV